MKENKLITSISMIGIYILILLVESVMMYLVNESNNFVKSLYMVIFLIIGALIVLKLVKPTLKKDFLKFKKNWKDNIKVSFKYWFLGFIGMIVSNIIIISLVGDISANQAANEEMILMYPLYGIVNCSIIAPLCEELVFRYNFKKTLKKSTTFLIVTSLIFGSMHVIFSSTTFIELLYIIPYSILGLGLGYAYYKTDNIWSSILMHAFHNSIALILIFLSL